MDLFRALTGFTFRMMGVALLLTTVVACSSLRRPPPVVDRSHDARLLADVQARLRGEPALQPSELRLELAGGVVRLDGSVAGVGAWEEATRNGQQVSGGVTVVV